MGGPKLTKQVGGGHNLPKPTRTQVISWWWDSKFDQLISYSCKFFDVVLTMLISQLNASRVWI
jgi:hypothetical protein